MERRKFLKTVVGAAAVAALPKAVFSAEAKPKLASDIIKLGPQKVPISRLGFGTGTVGWNKSSNQTRKLGLQGLADLLCAAYDQGVTYWDTADQYGSHPHIGEALKKLPREKVTILTKVHANTADELKNTLDRVRKELNTDYIDILLLHCVTDPKWNEKMRGAMDAILEAQQKGQVKTHGVSCHTLGALETAAAEPWVEVDLARINPAKVAMDADPDTVKGVLRKFKQGGKGVIGMKIFGEGKLRDKKDEMLKHALSLDMIDGFVIGIESREELDDLVQRIKTHGAAIA